MVKRFVAELPRKTDIVRRLEIVDRVFRKVLSVLRKVLSVLRKVFSPTLSPWKCCPDGRVSLTDERG